MKMRKREVTGKGEKLRRVGKKNKLRQKIAAGS
jgi:hypothetical protein